MTDFRVLASDIWTDSTFYSFLELSSNQNLDPASANLDNITVSNTVLLFQQAPLNSDFELHAHHLLKFRGTKFGGYLHLYQSIVKLAKARLDAFCLDDSLGVSPSVRNKATELVFKCITDEYVLRIISNRHIDVVIICSLYLAGRLKSLNSQIAFQNLLGVYCKFPHFLHTVICVYNHRLYFKFICQEAVHQLISKSSTMKSFLHWGQRYLDW